MNDEMMEAGTVGSDAQPYDDRARYIDLISQSPSDKKLVVAGPGTGKTHAFRQALSTHKARGLALTFINNLADDLLKELSDVADSFTFHGFCRHLLHQTNVGGLTSSFQYYPALKLLLASDIAYLKNTDVDAEHIEACFQKLDDSEGIISLALQAGTYYDAAGHTDSVYRMLRHFETSPESIPQYPLVVVDEYQDFTLLETQFIELLSSKNAVLIAGDDDQALYSFRHASADHIRNLARDTRFTTFELPYCSRCTEVIVQAVNELIDKAQSVGLLNGRLARQYHCYIPAKGKESKEFPSIIHAHCTVERKNAPYIGRYVSHCIREIPPDHIKESRAGGYPTVLVIGPMHFVQRVHSELRKEFSDITLKQSSGMEISILDGYRFLLKDNTSRLGWRIVLSCSPPSEAKSILQEALPERKDLYPLLPASYVEKHLQNAFALAKRDTGGDLSKDEVAALQGVIGQIQQEITATANNSGGGKSEADPNQASGLAEDMGLPPQIVCTSLQGAKGLSAHYVFIVGFNNGHFPQSSEGITDLEVCSLVVGLSRTRKQCHLISCGRFGKISLQPSVFLSWLERRLLHVRIDAKYFKAKEGTGPPA